MRIKNLGDFLHHVANVVRFDNEEDFNAAHAFINEAYPEVIADTSAPIVADTSATVAE